METSPKLNLFSCVRSSETSATPVLERSSSKTPPLKSIPKFNPIINDDKILIMTTIKDIDKKVFFKPKKFKFVFSGIKWNGLNIFISLISLVYFFVNKKLPTFL